MRSVCRSTQPVPHSVVPLRQLVTQVPAWQSWPSAQARPQAPQFFASERVSTQLPLQSSSGSPQLQLPPMQSSTASQAVPQPPQLRRSLVMSTQRPPQKAWPAGHDDEQVPPSHTEVAPHAVPQAPQFASSVRVSTQRPPQAVCPAAQTVLPGWQRLSTQE